jgi:hypothetical protein
MATAGRPNEQLGHGLEALTFEVTVMNCGGDPLQISGKQTPQSTGDCLTVGQERVPLRETPLTHTRRSLYLPGRRETLPAMPSILMACRQRCAREQIALSHGSSLRCGPRIEERRLRNVPLKRYLSLSGTKARTIAQWRGQLPSDNPVFLAYAERLAEGLRKAGLPE